MLGRSIGISEAKLAHLGDDPLPEGVYTAAEAAVIRYAQRSTRRLPIDEATYQDLAKHFTDQQLIALCFLVGVAQLVNRFNTTFLPEVDDYILEANAQADGAMGACPLPYPPMPA